MIGGGCLVACQAGACRSRSPDFSARSSDMPWLVEDPWGCLEACCTQVAYEGSGACQGDCPEEEGVGCLQTPRETQPGRPRLHHFRFQTARERSDTPIQNQSVR